MPHICGHTIAECHKYGSRPLIINRGLEPAGFILDQKWPFLTSAGNFLSETQLVGIQRPRINLSGSGEKAVTVGNSEMTERRKQLTDKEIRNFIDDLDNSESFWDSVTSSFDPGK